MAVRISRRGNAQKRKQEAREEKLNPNSRSVADRGDDDSDGSEFVPLEETDDESVSLEPEEMDMEEEEGTCQPSASSRKSVKGKRKATPKLNSTPKEKEKKIKKEKNPANGTGKGGRKEDSDESEQIWGPFGRDDDEVNPDELVRSRVFKEAEPPEGLLMDLLPFQKEFLAWGMDQERSKMKGGILADEVLFFSLVIDCKKVVRG